MFYGIKHARNHSFCHSLNVSKQKAKEELTKRSDEHEKKMKLVRLRLKCGSFCLNSTRKKTKLSKTVQRIKYCHLGHIVFQRYYTYKILKCE